MVRDAWKLLAAFSLAFGIGGMAQAARAAAPPAPTAEPAGPSDHDMLVDLQRDYNAAYNAKDAKKLVSHFAQDELFIFLVTPGERVSWNDYRKDWETFFAAVPGPVTNTISELSITVVGMVAYGHKIHHTTFTDKSGANHDVVARVTDVYRKIGERWQIVQEHASAPANLDNRNVWSIR